jgi:hypothetical protein
MSVQDAVPPPPSRVTRHLGAAALAALGVYLVVALSRVLETLFYVVGSYWQDPVGYLRQMLPHSAPEWFLTPLPFAFFVWLGLGVFFAIRAAQPTRTVVVRSVLTALVGMLAAGIVIAIAAFLTMAAAAASYGEPATASFDEVLLRFPGLYRSAVTAMTTLLTVGTLATLSAALLLREHLRKGATA